MSASRNTPPITRTVFTVEFVHPTSHPLPTFADGLDAVANGDAIGTTTDVRSEPLPDLAVGDALRRLAANGGYFDAYLSRASA